MAENEKMLEEDKRVKILTVRLGKEEEDMVSTLKGAPYFINMSEFIRESIRHFYDNRVNKAGRVTGHTK
jgi:Arc/MetJ-type ribon-helix-helix transcriptional regulator